MTGLEALKKMSMYFGLGEEYTKEFLEFLNIVETELKEYKKIEEKIGIDLVTFFKILAANRIFYRNEEGVICEARQISIGYALNDDGSSEDDLSITLIEYGSRANWWSIKLRDYGVTWALTREELK